MKYLSLLATALLVALQVTGATPQGPDYPPEGGVTWAGSGGLGTAGGLTWSYADLDLNRFNGIWWGVAGANGFQVALDGAIDGGTEILTYDADSDIANGTAQWLGASNLTYGSGGQWVTSLLATRLTLTATDSDNNPIPFIDPTTVGLDSSLGALIATPAAYQTNLLAEAKYNGNWIPVNDLHDWLGTACDGCVRTSVAAGFYTDPNLPPVADFSWSDDPTEGEPVTFTSNATDPEGRPMSLAWDLTDDGVHDDGYNETATTTFTDPGTYNVSLQVTDDRGLMATALRQVEVVDCARGPVSDGLRNTVYPLTTNVTGETVRDGACTLSDNSFL